MNYEARAALKSLGYVGGSVDTDLSFDQTRADPKDLLQIHNLLQRVLLLTHDRQYQQALELCRRIIDEHPDIGPA